MVLSIHVAAGGLALVLGAVALLVRKGGTLHRRVGLLFVLAMLMMASTAAILGNGGGGLMTAYFVVTALATVRSDAVWSRRITAAALIVPAALGLGVIWRGVQAFSSPGLAIGGVPFAMFFFIGAILLLAAAGDVRVIRVGVPRGRTRLARHLWRMCFALFIAAGSFFSIRERVAKVLPEPFTTLPMRVLPIALVFVAMFYWLWRMGGRRPVPVLVRRE